MANNKRNVLALKQVRRAYGQGERRLEVLRGVSLTIGEGEMVALVGPSGSGKTTLLQIAGLLDAPDSGEVAILGRTMGAAGDAARTRARGEHIGFVYQFHHLLPEFSALENVVMPQLIAGKTRKSAEEKARALLESLGLQARLTHRPGELSGGEQQRVAIARALANDPALLIADEPTGNLDPDTAGAVFGNFMECCRKYNLSVLMATHNPELAAKMTRIVHLSHGLLAG